MKRLTVLLVVTVAAAAICAALLYLAWDAEAMPGLTHRGLQLQINLEAGQILFGLLGGGALLWAADTYWRRDTGSRGPEGGQGGSPSAPHGGPLTDEEQREFLELEPAQMLLRIYERQKRLEALIRARRLP